MNVYLNFFYFLSVFVLHISALETPVQPFFACLIGRLVVCRCCLCIRTSRQIFWANYGRRNGADAADAAATVVGSYAWLFARDSVFFFGCRLCLAGRLAARRGLDERTQRPAVMVAVVGI